jgi:hypothetical protein
MLLLLLYVFPHVHSICTLSAPLLSLGLFQVSTHFPFLLSITLSASSKSLILANYDSCPKSFFNTSGQLSAAFSSIDSWVANSLSSELLISPPDSGSAVLCVSLYSCEAISAFAGTVEVVQSQRQPVCPYNCSSNGNCTASGCQCRLGYIGKGCTVPVSLFSSVLEQKVQVDPAEWQIAYVVTDSFQSVLVNIEDCSDSLYLFTSTENQLNSIPSMANSKAAYILSVTNFTINTPDNFLVLSFFCNNDNGCYASFTFSAIPNENYSTSIIISSITIAVGLTAGLVLMLFCCRLYRKCMAKIDNRRSSKVADYVILKHPEMIWSDQTNDKTCAICFEDYDLQSKVRVFECTHGFHSECIDLWIQRKAICPTCKRTLASLN